MLRERFSLIVIIVCNELFFFCVFKYVFVLISLLPSVLLGGKREGEGEANDNKKKAKKSANKNGEGGGGRCGLWCALGYLL